MKRGQIIPKGNRRWLVRVFLGRDGLGKRHYTSKQIEGPLGEARRELTLMLADAQRHENVRPNRQTMEQFYPDWLASKRKIAAHTRSQYEERVAQDILPFFGKTLLKDMTPQLVQRWVEWMQGKGHSARTIQYSAGLLKQLVRLAFRWQLIPSIPTDGVELPQLEHVEQEILTPAQMAQLLDKTAGSYWHPLWSLLLTGGLRPQEALALDVADLAGVRVSISKALTEDEKGRTVIGPTKTKKSRRTVALPEGTIEALRGHLKAHGIIAGLIFRNERGTPWDLSKVRKAWKRACKAAEVPVVRLYDARHSHLTALLAAGVPLKVASERAGHASVKITGDIYSHVLPEMDDRAAKVMADLIAAKPAARTETGAVSAGQR